MSNTIEQTSVIINETNKAGTKPEEKLSMNYVLEQIEKLSGQTEYLGQVIGAIGQLERVDQCGDAVGGKIEAQNFVIFIQSRFIQELYSE